MGTQLIVVARGWRSQMDGGAARKLRGVAVLGVS